MSPARHLLPLLPLLACAPSVEAQDRPAADTARIRIVQNSGYDSTYVLDYTHIVTGRVYLSTKTNAFQLLDREAGEGLDVEAFVVHDEAAGSDVGGVEAEVGKAVDAGSDAGVIEGEGGAGEGGGIGSCFGRGVGPCGEPGDVGRFEGEGGSLDGAFAQGLDVGPGGIPGLISGARGGGRDSSGESGGGESEGDPKGHAVLQ